MPAKVTLRFVTGNSTLDSLIRLQAGVCMPFTPTHVESVSLDGQWWIGEHMNGGMQKRPRGYDAATTLHEIFVDVPCAQDQADAYYAFLDSRIGEPYDWKAIVSFVDPDANLHSPNHMICSAITTQALRKAQILRWPLTVPFHHISPRDLLLVVSALVEVPHPEMPL